ncbi:cellulase family glycosylhydrolase [Pseudenhygromyxa sp. WMMC2535]|uniref:cellulase family glycosylhydrolase n=1 Tax=Pseudenhygromyxa sp. WMMC2535 TaxID=2712867 RepID=UPI001553B716|nr:cellulase family glycosylhydrolase [Pseudenhygromyxa sp. WMMC2535]NVB40008.1 cellulase family glycosylhydrolase [Pseudenhygromyxa sp. WMMC2535]
MIIAGASSACGGASGEGEALSVSESGAGDDIDTAGTGETGEGGEDVGEDEGEAELPPELIVDADNRALIFHGINVHNASKYQADRLPTITQDDVARMAHDWGFNVVRLLIFWDAIEPEPGIYDDAYLAAIGERMAWFADEDIAVILDMHQDVYSEAFCCDGAPTWAIFDDGEAFEQQSLWSANYLQPAVQHAFDNFWAGDGGAHPELQEHYVLAWQHVAETFAGTPNLIGYDLMNEPFPGTAWEFGDIDAAEPSAAVAAWGQDALTPFYARMTAGIREIDEDSWIFIEPRYGAAAAGRPAVLGHVEDPRAAGPRIVYFPHLYPIEAEVFGAWSASNPTLDNWESAREAEQAELGGAVMLGEFGIMPDWDFGPELLEDILTMADRATSGWTYWSYDTNGRGIIDPMGEERPAAAVLTRPYARAVAGTPLVHVYDAHTRELHLEFEHRQGVSGPTEIYIPQSRWYPEGWELVVDDPEGSWTSEWDAAREVLSLTTDPGESPHVVELRPAL